jgi:hypothetical protein
MLAFDPKEELGTEKKSTYVLDLALLVQLVKHPGRLLKRRTSIWAMTIQSPNLFNTQPLTTNFEALEYTLPTQFALLRAIRGMRTTDHNLGINDEVLGCVHFPEKSLGSPGFPTWVNGRGVDFTDSIFGKEGDEFFCCFLGNVMLRGEEAAARAHDERNTFFGTHLVLLFFGITKMV